MSGIVLFVYRCLGPYAFWCKLASVLVACVCAFYATQLTLKEDIRTLMPTKPPELAEQFTSLRDAPFMQELVVTVSGENPIALADTLATRLRGPLIARILPDANARPSPALLAQFCKSMPSLLDASAYKALHEKLTPIAMERALQQDARTLLTPRGLAVRELLALDPLGLCASSMQGLLPDVSSSALRLENSHIVSADGAHVLLLLEPATPMTDAAAAAKLMEHLRQAADSLPEGTEVIVAGGHRHSADNAAIIKDDLQRIIPVSMGLLLVAFFVFVRSWQGLFIVVAPAVTVVVAMAVTRVLCGSLSGIVLGFGSVVLGITADYFIHVYYAFKDGADPRDSLRRVSQPLLVGAVTTLVAMAAFLSSSIPSVVQMAVFATSGILAAVIFALAILPLCLTCGTQAAVPLARPLQGRGLLGVWGALVLLLGWLLYTLPIDGDVRTLSYVAADTRAAEERTRHIWGALREQSLLSLHAQGPNSLEEVLERNDKLWEGLQKQSDSAAILSLAPMLPSRTLQDRRHEQWRNFWAEQSSSVLPIMDSLATAQGFSAGAFAPFKDWIQQKPPYVSAQSLSALGFDLPVRMLLRTQGDSTRLYSLIPPHVDVRELEPVLAATGAVHISGNAFRHALNASTRADLIKFGGIALLGTLAACVIFLRSGLLCALALIPVACGLTGVLLCFRLMGISVNIFHTLALPLVLALSIDYGVFMVARLQGVLSPNTTRAVLLSGLTSLSGFGALLLGQHSVLFSLGLTVSIGLASALVGALWLLPRLVRFAGDAKGGKDAGGVNVAKEVSTHG